MNSINPVCKMIGILIPILILAAAHNPILNLAIFFLSLLIMIVSKVSVRKLFLFLLPISLIAIGLFFTGYHFEAQSEITVNANMVFISNSAVWNGLTLASRVLVYASLGLLFALTTDKIELVRSLQQQLKLPPMFAYGILAAWNIFPNIMEEYQKTKVALEARGISTKFISPRQLKPMLIKAIHWSNALAIAMESKGFNGHAKRTEYFILKPGWKDILFPVVTTTTIIFAVIVMKQWG